MSTFQPGIANQLPALLQKAAAHYQAGEWSAAELVLTRIFSAQPRHADALHLMALVRAGQDRHSDALPFFERALTAAPQNVEARSNMGNSLWLLGRRDEAVRAYQASIRANPRFVRAHAALADAHRAMGNPDAAESTYREALRHNPDDAGLLLGLGALLNDTGRPAEAEAAERRALERNPAPRVRAALEHNLGLSLNLQGRSAEALPHYARAQALVPDLPFADHNRANALQNIGRFDDALQAYRKAIARNPLAAEAHRGLNELLYRMRRDDEFLVSYDKALALFPTAAALPIAKAETLLQCDRVADAVESFDRALAIDPDNLAALDGLAVASARLGKTDSAIAAHERVVAARPDDPNPWINFAQTMLGTGDAKRALTLAQEAIARAPHDQGALSMLSIALRAAGDERDEDLMRYGAFIQVFDLDPPEGYSDMAAFNGDLDSYLNALHTDKREYFEQTLRNGTQTRDRLFDAGHGLVERLRQRIDEAIGAYIQRIGYEEAHPFTGRRRGGHRFSGSWSSRLRDCGFHTNHIHSKGWISSCYYIALPEAVSDVQGKQGWIKFGEPSFDAGLKDPIRKAIQPRAGRLVLFPSYMWHGTVPFHSRQDRTTIAFDAVPAP
jgi:tetratricopeptide (TPR) repeat protein